MSLVSSIATAVVAGGFLYSHHKNYFKSVKLTIELKEDKNLKVTIDIVLPVSFWIRKIWGSSVDPFDDKTQKSQSDENISKAPAGTHDEQAGRGSTGENGNSGSKGRAPTNDKKAGRGSTGENGNSGSKGRAPTNDKKAGRGSTGENGNSGSKGRAPTNDKKAGRGSTGENGESLQRL